MKKIQLIASFNSIFENDMVQIKNLIESDNIQAERSSKIKLWMDIQKINDRAVS